MYDTVASCSEDTKVKIYKRENPAKDEWTEKEIKLDVPVWKISWS